MVAGTLNCVLTALPQSLWSAEEALRKLSSNSARGNRAKRVGEVYTGSVGRITHLSAVSAVHGNSIPTELWD
jgi:hypothetical protein